MVRIRQSMAGWSMIVDGSALDCFKTVQKVQEKELWLDLAEFNWSEGAELDKLRYLFGQFLSVFLKAKCGNDCFWPLPPMLGNGQSMGVFRLYLVVSARGGYETVSEDWSWDIVAKECGFNSSVSSAVKLIYIKYLDALSKWLQSIVEAKGSNFGLEDSVYLAGFSMDLESNLKGLLLKISNQKKKDGEKLHLHLKKNELDSMGVENLCNGEGFRNFMENVDDVKDNVIVDSNFVNENVTDDTRRIVDYAKHNMVVDSCIVVEHNADDQRNAVDDVEGNVFLDSNVVKEDDSKRKRKRACYSGMLSWVIEVAKDPCDPAIGCLPERSRWKCHGDEQLWKQVLFIREAMFLKGNDNSSAEHSIWQKKQKMHPSMYDDHNGSEKLRCSQRLLSAKDSPTLLSLKIPKVRGCSESSSSDTQSELDDHFDNQLNPSTDDSIVGLWASNHKPKRIPVGPYFQAEVPEWTGQTFESDSKWLGTRVWPLKKGQHNLNLIERDRIGKGRQDSCGCQVCGSLECVRFHVSAKRKMLKFELGLAFNDWKFDMMGEDVALSWRKEEQQKFQAIVKSNPPSQDKSYWDEIYKMFPNKSREHLVSYFFNVFLLQRRGYQNRSSSSCIDSDDDVDDSEFGGREAVKSPGSIFCSPKKPHLNLR